MQFLIFGKKIHDISVPWDSEKAFPIETVATFQTELSSHETFSSSRFVSCIQLKNNS
jgi:hypothetical protein